MTAERPASVPDALMDLPQPFKRYRWLMLTPSPMSQTERSRAETLLTRRSLAMDQITSIDDELTTIFHQYDRPRPISDNPQA